MREALLAAVLVAAATLVVVGTAMWSVPAALILGGLLVAGLGALFLVNA